MNYALFCYILNENLAYKPGVSKEEKEEYYQDMYTHFREASYVFDADLPVKQQVVTWLIDSMGEITLDTHNYCLRLPNVWIDANETKPPENLAVLVFIPGEDNHITAGMWDVSKVWILLDEYREPNCEVTHWQLLPEPPTQP